jgi:cell division protein FtsB
MNMPHEELVWDYVTLNAKKCVLEDENDKLTKEIQRLKSVVDDLVTLYLGRDAK